MARHVRTSRPYTTSVHHVRTSRPSITSVHHVRTSRAYTTSVHHVRTSRPYTTSVHHVRAPRPYAACVQHIRIPHPYHIARRHANVELSAHFESALQCREWKTITVLSSLRQACAASAAYCRLQTLPPPAITFCRVLHASIVSKYLYKICLLRSGRPLVISSTAVAAQYRLRDKISIKCKYYF